MSISPGLVTMVVRVALESWMLLMRPRSGPVVCSLT
jgi:hypothetical protein